MNVKDLFDGLPVELLAGRRGIEREVTGGYSSDLLSYVMSNAGEGNVWVTMQGHQNIVAVSSLTGISAILVTGGVKVNEDTKQKAEEAQIPLYWTEIPSFEIIGMLYNRGIKGGDYY